MRIKQNTGDPSLFAFEFWKMLLTESRQYLNVATYVWVTPKDSKKVQEKRRKNFLVLCSCISGVWCSSRSNKCWEEKVGYLKAGLNETFVI